jgi:hypothetical protein
MLGWISADPSCILNSQYVYMSCLDGLVQTHLIPEMAKMSTCHASMVWCTPILHLKWPRCLHVMLGWFSADLSYLKWPRCLLVMLGWFSAEPSYLKWPRFLHVMLGRFSADPSYILNGQDVYISCLDGLVQTHLVS